MSSADESVAAALRARPEVLRGILLMCAGVSMFPFMNAAVKLLTAGYPVSQIVWARFTGLAAVARGNVYRAPADLLARPSPRIAEGAADVCARLDEARAKPASS